MGIGQVYFLVLMYTDIVVIWHSQPVGQIVRSARWKAVSSYYKLAVSETRQFIIN